MFLFASLFGAVVFAILTWRDSQRKAGALFATVVFVLVAFGSWQAVQHLSGGIFSERYGDTLSKPISTFKSERGGNITALWNLILYYPFGSGYHAKMLNTESNFASGSVKNALALRNGETQFGAVTSDLGVPGLLLFGALMIRVTRLGWIRYRSLRSAELKTLAAMFIACLAAYFLGCFGGPVLHGAIHFWFIAGLLVALPRIEQSERGALSNLLPKVPGVGYENMRGRGALSVGG